MNANGEFEILGTILEKEDHEKNGRRKIDIVIEDYFGKKHHVQVRPNQFFAIENMKDSEAATFIVRNEYSYCNAHHNNFILRHIKK